MHRFLAFALATTALAAAATEAYPALAQAPSAAAASKPQYGTFGFDTSGMDRSVAPGNDFYQFANGTWAKNTPIPSDQSNYGSFSVLDDLSHERTRDILEQAKNDPNSRIGTAYATYLDAGAIESKGLAPIQPLLNEIRSLKSKAGYAKLAATARRNGVGTPFGTFVNIDDKNPNSYSMNVVQAGLGMPDRDYYLSPDPKLAATKTAYEKHVANMLTLAGETNAAARAHALVDFETDIAKVSWTKVQNRDSKKTYNKMSLAALARSAPGFDFPAYFKAAGVSVDSVIVAQPTAVNSIAKLVGAAPLQVLK